MQDLNVGDRIELVAMPGDPCPIPPGSHGTVTRVYDHTDGGQISVEWDNGRKLMLCVPPDRYRVLSRAGGGS